MAFLLVLAVLRVLLQAVHCQQQACEVCSCIGSGAFRTMDCTPRPDLTGTDFRFTSIPQNGPLDIRVIIMTGNSLSSLAPGSFSSYPSLETVVLNDNLFTEVPSEGFYNLSITNLTFDGNPLTGLGAAVFSNLTSLQHLSVRRTTTLGSIDGGQAFGGLNSLLSLSLDDNLLQSLLSDFLSSVPQLRILSLKNNSIQTLPEDLFAPISISPIQIDLSLNPWSCDCFLQWLRSTINDTTILENAEETVCHWPLAQSNPTMTPIGQVPVTDYRCYEPTITLNASNSTLLSNITLTIPCGLDAAPFPEVTWLKDGIVVNFTSRVHISRYDSTLQFESQGVDDSGEYQCLLVNVNGTAESSVANITILESTCFDNSLTMSRETDVDCGGQFCVPCNITKGCLLDRDCQDELVCLYAHSLPSSLHYISPFNPDAYTCARATVPPFLLEAILQSKLPLDIFSTNVSAEADAPMLHSAVHDLLALQLEVSRSTIGNVRVSTVEKIAQPLIQVWFDLPKTLLGEEAGNKLMEQIDNGSLRATVRRREESNFISYRLNL